MLAREHVVRLRRAGQGRDEDLAPVQELLERLGVAGRVVLLWDRALLVPSARDDVLWGQLPSILTDFSSGAPQLYSGVRSTYAVIDAPLAARIRRNDLDPERLQETRRLARNRAVPEQARRAAAHLVVARRAEGGRGRLVRVGAVLHLVACGPALLRL